MLRVIIPTLGKSPYLLDVLDSVKRQPLKLELIIVSKIALNISDEVAGNIPVRIVHDSGKGLYSAINEGLSVPGKWNFFTYINDDDLLVSTFVDLAGAIGSGVTYGRVDLIDERGAVLTPLPVCREPKRLKQYWSVQRTPLTQQGTIVSRDVYERFGGFDTSFRYAGDMEYWCRLLNADVPFRFIDARVASFRVAAGQLSEDRFAFETEKERIRKMYGLELRGWRRRWYQLRFYAENLGVYWKRARASGLRRGGSYFGS